MTIVTKPSQLEHTPTSTNQNVPSENSYNGYFSRYWREEDDHDGNRFRVDRVKCLTAGEETGDAGYALGIQFGDGLETKLAFEGAFTNDTDKEYLGYLLQLVSLSAAEDVGMDNLAPLDYATDDAEVTAWVNATWVM